MSSPQAYAQKTDKVRTSTLVVCIIGSLRFYKKMLAISDLLTKYGITPLLPMPGKYRSPTNPGEYASFYHSISLEEKVRDDTDRVEEHLEKVKNCDIVYLVNPSGYFGDHTLGEIYVAHENGKPIYALEPINGDSPFVIAGWIKETLLPPQLLSLLICSAENTIAEEGTSRTAKAQFITIGTGSPCDVELRFEHMDDIYENAACRMADDIRSKLGTQTKIQFIKIHTKCTYLYPAYLMKIQFHQEDFDRLIKGILPHWLGIFKSPITITIRRDGKEVPYPQELPRATC